MKCIDFFTKLFTKNHQEKFHGIIFSKPQYPKFAYLIRPYQSSSNRQNFRLFSTKNRDFKLHEKKHPNVLLLTVLYLIFAITTTIEGSIKEIAIVSKTSDVGEKEFISRLVIAAERLGISITTISAKNTNKVNYKYDFIIITTPAEYYHYCPNYLMVLHPMGWFENDKLKSCYQQYDGYLTVLRQGKLAESLEPRLEWYPSTYSTPFSSQMPKRLLHFISAWGSRKNDSKYKELYQNLDEINEVIFYGTKVPPGLELKKYKGSLPFDGKAVDEAIKDAGICLILHSQTHLDFGIPSGRIFEAAAASAVIISDMNSFIVEEFGDSVLYIDHLQSASNIGKQVQDHLEWILAHPIEAKDMAKRAHKIFCDRFSLEKQLTDLMKFHDEQMNK